MRSAIARSVSQPARPPLVKVDVDRGAVPLGEAEYDVQVPFAIAVERGWIETPDDVGALAHGRVQEVGGAGCGEDAALREGDDLDAEALALELAQLEHGVEVGEPRDRIDVHVRADVAGAVGHDLPHQCLGALTARQLGVGFQQELPLDLDALGEARRRPVRSPAHSGEALVQVDVAIDERRAEQRAAELDAPVGAHAPNRRAGWPRCTHARWRHRRARHSQSSRRPAADRSRAPAGIEHACVTRRLAHPDFRPRTAIRQITTTSRITTRRTMSVTRLLPERTSGTSRRAGNQTREPMRGSR